MNTRFDEAIVAFQEQVDLTAAFNATDPELVLVLEGIDERVDLASAARKLGLEIVGETESAIEPDDDFALTSSRPRDPLIVTCLHAVCADAKSFNRLLRAWRVWEESRQIKGNHELRDLFGHLKDVRPWSPRDRLQAIDWDEYFAGRIDGAEHAIEIELWYRRGPAARAAARAKVTAALSEQGGSVTSSVDIESIGYHALKCSVPTDLLRSLAREEFDEVKVVKSAEVLYLRVSGQALPVELELIPPADRRSETPEAPSDRPPVLCLLDGVPVANHPLLRGRLVVHDPDDLAADSTVEERRHGTAMASAAVWGDLSDPESVPVARPILVRPILTPAEDRSDRAEELPAHRLAPDLMWQVFRELFESEDGVSPVGSDVLIVNLSVGDPACQFETALSAWARMLDWLSYSYGVLVIVSAGNHGRLRIAPMDTDTFGALTGPDRRDALLDSMRSSWTTRRILSPAESINAITVGAVHEDRSGIAPLGYLEDPAGGEVCVSPVSGLGRGYRRAVKPDLAAPGGRAMYRSGPPTSDTLVLGRTTPVGPGVRVAAPSGDRQTYVVGTSVAAASVSRTAAGLADLLDRIAHGQRLSRRQRAVAVKALLAHGAEMGDELLSDSIPTAAAIGNGALRRDLSEGCSTNEAVVLFLGRLGSRQRQDLNFPLPNGLAVREVKRISATLAWLSPVNWSHRQYRRARLYFTKPHGDIPSLDRAVGLSSDEAQRGASTVQHLEWETDKSFAAGQGSTLDLSVACFEQAGGLNGELVDYAAVVSLWVAPTIGVDVYTQVREQLTVPVLLRPSPA